jgi:hypothetical protein
MASAHRPRVLKPPLRIVLSVLLLGLSAAVWSPPAAEAQTAAIPPYPAAGLGAKGPCGGAPTDAELDTDDLDGSDAGSPAMQTNAIFPSRHVWVYEPTGTGSPRTGGTCNDNRRPVVLVVHGFPAQELIFLGEALPFLYGTLIQNLVTNGYIVVFANYDAVSAFADPGDFVDPTRPDRAWATVWVGFDQAVRGFVPGNIWGLTPRAPMTTRADLREIGFFGHSLGGGMLPWLSTLTTLQTWDHDGNPGTPLVQWSSQALWANFSAASDLMWHCRSDDDDGDGQWWDGLDPEEDDPPPFPGEYVPPDNPFPPQWCTPARHRVQMPVHANVLFTSYEGEEFGFAVWHATNYMFQDMTEVRTKWSVLVPHDCTHPEVPPSCSEPPTKQPTSTRTGHLTPTDPVWQAPEPWARARNHLKWYSVNRNFQALAECAQPPVTSGECNSSRLAPMGTWSDGEAATPAIVLTP